MDPLIITSQHGAFRPLTHYAAFEIMGITHTFATRGVKLFFAEFPCAASMVISEAFVTSLQELLVFGLIVFQADVTFKSGACENIRVTSMRVSVGGHIINICRL